MGNYKTDAEMEQADQAVSSDLEKPEGRSRRTRGKKADSVQAEAPEEKTGRTRKSRSEVQAENEQKIEEHDAKVSEALDEAFPGQEEVPFDEAADVADTVPQPDLQKPPRRTRKERNAEKADSESITLDTDTYFYIPADDNYVMKHAGDTSPEGGEVITKEEFNAGVKRLAQEKTTVSDEPLDGAMNQPEQHVRGQRRRRRS